MIRTGSILSFAVPSFDLIRVINISTQAVYRISILTFRWTNDDAIPGG
jgi:hypothetical protein